MTRSPHIARRLGFALAACAALGLAGAAQAASMDHSATSTVNCSRLPVSQRGICSLHKPDQDKYASDETLSAVRHRRVASEASRYRTLAAACKKLPVSQRNTCMDNVGIDTGLMRAG